jgi:hypothetical protein
MCRWTAISNFGLSKRWLVGLILPWLLAAAATASAEGQLARASGHGHMRTNADGIPDPEGELRTFSFTVGSFQDGTVLGQAQLKNRASGLRVHVDVDCMIVIDNIAVMSGVISHTNELSPAFTEGASVFFAVRDHGEGAHNPHDEITQMFVAAPFPIPDLCLLVVATDGPPPDEILFPIEGGNIQVSP